VTTLEGIIVDWDLFAANTDERETDEREGALDLLEICSKTAVTSLF